MNDYAQYCFNQSFLFIQIQNSNNYKKNNSDEYQKRNHNVYIFFLRPVTIFSSQNDFKLVIGCGRK